MYKIFKSTNTGKILEIDEIEHNCWVQMIAPTNEEIELVSSKTKVDAEYIKDALDDEELSRIEFDEDNNTTSIIIKIPFAEIEREHKIYDTIPLGIIHCPTCIITVTSQDNVILNDFRSGNIKTFFIYKKSRFIMQILYRTATLYLLYLRQIDRQSEIIEAKLHKTMRNKELIQLLDLEKSLVYFSTSLKYNEKVLRKLTKVNFMNKYEEDTELLEDIVIENQQAIEMAKMYSDILSGTRDAFASVISNNLNSVMKFLASITIVMAIPTMISSFFGMNVTNIPFSQTPFGFFSVVIISVLITSIIAVYMFKKEMF